MNKLLPLLILLSGCSTFQSEQTQTAPDGTGTKTVVRLHSFWDSHSELAKLRTTLTEKSQGISIGAMSQDTSATNAIALLQVAISAAVEAAVRATIKP